MRKADNCLQLNHKWKLREFKSFLHLITGDWILSHEKYKELLEQLIKTQLFIKECHVANVAKEGRKKIVRN